jgi:hypothetical protein
LGERELDLFEENILESLHDHFFFIAISNLPTDSHYVHFKSYVELSANAWLFAFLVIFFPG